MGFLGKTDMEYIWASKQENLESCVKTATFWGRKYMQKALMYFFFMYSFFKAYLYVYMFFYLKLNYLYANHFTLFLAFPENV